MTFLNWFRRRGDEEPTYPPLWPRDGWRERTPAAVFRKLEWLRQAMIDGDKPAVQRLQYQLSKSGWEVPTTASECTEIAERLRKR